MFGKKKSKNTMPEETLKKLDKTPLIYVTERDIESGQEKILGRAGGINVVGGELYILCSGNDIFRADIKTISAGELMNLSGVTIKGYDKLSNSERSIVAYYGEDVVSVYKKK